MLLKLELLLIGYTKLEIHQKNINRVNKDQSGAQQRAREWLRNIVEMNKTAGNPEEFFENVKNRFIS